MPELLKNVVNETHALSLGPVVDIYLWFPVVLQVQNILQNGRGLFEKLMQLKRFEKLSIKHSLNLLKEMSLFRNLILNKWSLTSQSHI